MASAMGLPKASSAELPLLGAFEFKFSFSRFMRFIGPGLLMSIAYVDPGNLESDLQVGARAGYSLLWVLLWSTVLGYVLQMQAAKLGVVTRKNLAEHCRARFTPGPRLLLWAMAEIAIIGSDVQEVIGSAIAILLLTGGAVPLWGGILISAAAAFLLLLVERLGVRHLEALFALLISTMVGAFLHMYVVAGVPTAQVLRGFLVPWVPRQSVGQAVAMLGSLLMPHNLYLHSALVQTRRLRAQDEGHRREALAYFGLESALSLGVSVLINTCVVCVFAAGYFGRPEVEDIGLENAGQYLGATYGAGIVVIWALGLLAAGQSSTMTGCYTGQFVMGGFLHFQVSAWVRILVTRLVALVPTLAVAFLSGGAGSSALDRLNQVLNLLQSVQLPFALLPVLAFNADPSLMGPFANSAPATAALSAASAAVVGINLAGVWAFAGEHLAGAPAAAWGGAGAGVVVYMGLLAYVVAAIRRGPPEGCGGGYGGDAVVISAVAEGGGGGGGGDLAEPLLGPAPPAAAAAAAAARAAEEGLGAWPAGAA
ncbi:MAG: natural resistance-associated macrophage protein-domain-containing protein [Monoraphidium minutum]|nr:MAG: natural resistance-associated macrophage protein-domain-containing protein [Monoraphidium minutum]